MPCARKIGTYKGRPVYRVPVRVTLNNSGGRVADWLAPPRAVFEVLAHSPADAANWARDAIGTRAETEIEAYGVKGGCTRRYIGWQSAMFASMMEGAPRAVQLALDL